MTIAERIVSWFTSLNDILSQCNHKITTKNGTAAQNYSGLPSAIDTIRTGHDVSGVTATADKVLSGSVFVDANGAEVTGTMPDKGKTDITLNGITTNSVAIPQGYHNGNGAVTLDGNIKDEVSAQKALIQSITNIIDQKASAYPNIAYDSTTKTLTITEVT